MYMEESLAWLRAPETQPALGDLLCGLIRDIRLILIHPDLANAAKLAAITATVDQMAPPPGPQVINAQAAACAPLALGPGGGASWSTVSVIAPSLAAVPRSECTRISRISLISPHSRSPRAGWVSGARSQASDSSIFIA